MAYGDDWPLRNHQVIIECLLEGLSNKEIAQRLGITVKAVKCRLGRIAKAMKIDHSLYVSRVRIVYLVVRQLEQEQITVIGSADYYGLLC